jgi:hypothetical protein
LPASHRSASTGRRPRVWLRASSAGILNQAALCLPSTFLNERASLSPDMAIRIEKAFGVSMETLMRMQNSYDIAQAHSREGEIKVNRHVRKAKESTQRKLL